MAGLFALVSLHRCLNESPRPKAGKSVLLLVDDLALIASMKVPARRRGNFLTSGAGFLKLLRLNESPRPKAGKCPPQTVHGRATPAPQ